MGADSKLRNSTRESVQANGVEIVLIKLEKQRNKGGKFKIE